MKEEKSYGAVAQTLFLFHQRNHHIHIALTLST